MRHHWPGSSPIGLAGFGGGGDGRGDYGGGGAGFGGAIFIRSGNLNLFNNTFSDSSTAGGAGYTSGSALVHRPLEEPGAVPPQGSNASSQCRALGD